MAITIKILICTLLLAASSVYAQKKTASNYSVITNTDTEADIIRKAANVTPHKRQLRWQQLEMTAFLVFGINTYTDKEWGNGKEDPKLFNPSSLDAKQWVRVCKEAGMKQVIFTAKHHDGFCLWPSKFTNHSVKQSPWKEGKGDVVKEVAEACKTYGMGFGIYLSPWDMNHPAYGTEAYNDYFVNQLTELLTNYGRVDEVWFDGAHGKGANGKKQVYDFNRWYTLIRKLQPHAVIAIMGPDVRWVGTESGYGRETEWSVLPVDNLNQHDIADNSQKDINFRPTGNLTGSDIGSRKVIKNAKGLVWYPAETDVSIRPGWYYHEAEDAKVKTPEKLLDIYYSSVGRNGVLLLNIPPDKRGLINDHDIKSLSGFTKLRLKDFERNLISTATLSATPSNKLKGIADNRYKTYWQAIEGDTAATINIRWKYPQVFDVLLLQENITIGQRIECFVLEYKNATGWKQIVEGTTVGYKRLLRFNEVKAKEVRLRILSSRLHPTLSAMGLYKRAK